MAADTTTTVYTPWRLAFYDIWVLGIVSTWAWGCSTAAYLIPLFRSNVRSNHLDIGAGTGYYLRKAGIPATSKLTIVDNERPALDMAVQRSRRPDARAIVADILKPLPLPSKDRFDSVSMYYLLHCIPAPVQDKCRVFELVKHNMTADGVIHGANVLGKGVRKDNRFAAFIRRGCLNHGVFHNSDDNAYDFEHALRLNFKEVETWVVGSVFIFRAAKPRYD
ncbi:uncharacterized protein K452DRAFT_292709, partial [Aplosporella prunicola CBS 121167]